MSLLDSIKNAAGKAKDAAQGAVSSVQASIAEKKAEQEEQARIAAEHAQAAKEAMETALSDGRGTDRGMFEGSAMKDIIAFTSDYMTKLVLPANSMSVSKLKMHPYLSDKGAIKDITKRFPAFDTSEQLLLTFNNSTKKEFIAISDKHMYLTLAVAEEPQNFYSLVLALTDISSLDIKLSDDGENYDIVVNGVTLMTVPRAQREGDILSLDYFFNCIKNADFEITDEEIDTHIHQVIGEEAYTLARKAMDEDERILYFAWGCDNCTAKDFLMCTTRQFIMIDRELGGLSVNTKRFEYCDIVSMETKQDDGSGAIGILLNAAFSLCDLQVYVPGTSFTIQTLSRIEADRVMQLYTVLKRKAKEESKQPIVVQAAAPEVDPLEQLAKLQKLKEAGVLSEEEFAQKKAALLSKI